jgi:DNA-binding response OmpR family regulator
MNKKKKILIADDDRPIVESLTLLLEAADYDVISTTEGNNISEMYTQQPDLLLLDIWMSGIDGRDVCKKLKNDAMKKHIPIIIFSASTEIETSAKKAGADDFIAKPFEMKELLAKVANYI